MKKHIIVENIFNHKALNNKGLEVDFSQYECNVLMVVNTASKCGFTPQYDGLEALYQKYKDQGFVIVGFPCDQFAHQKPDSDEEIAEFCLPQPWCHLPADSPNRCELTTELFQTLDNMISKLKNNLKK